MSEKQDQIGKYRDLSAKLKNVMSDALKDDEESNKDKPQEVSDFNSTYDAYKDEKFIDKGGIKEVRKKKDLKTGRSIAMATLRPEFQKPGHINRFLREGRILASLEHPNIVPLHEIGFYDNDLPFFTMKLLSGETLANIIKQRSIGTESTTSIDDLLNIFIKVCDAIAYAHSKGIIHLDLKPENIQVSDFGEVLVLDWGSAKQIGDEIETGDEDDTYSMYYSPLISNITSVGTINGTPGYMSPEQISGDKDSINEKSDIYALGAALYSILYSKRPHDGLTVEEVLMRTRDGKEPDHSQKVEGKVLPPALRAIIKKAMSHDPDMRYNNVEELKHDIQLYMNDFATHAENINILKLMHLFGKRHFKSIAVTVAFLLIVSYITFLSFSELKKQEKIVIAQNTKINATADEIISGTIEKHNAIRQKYAYGELLENYKKLRNVGYTYPEFWHDEGRLYAGELEFEKALNCYEEVLKLNSSIAQTPHFKKEITAIRDIIKNKNGEDLTPAEITKFSHSMSGETKIQIFWNLNRNPNYSIKEKMDILKQNIIQYNFRLSFKQMNFNYSIEDDYIKLDLSNNLSLRNFEPIVGIPVDEINLSNCSDNVAVIYQYSKGYLSALNLSGLNLTSAIPLLQQSNIKKLIARNSTYSALNLNNAPNIKHLDLQGAKIINHSSLKSAPDLHYLNIAFSDFQNYDFLIGCISLKRLDIDASQLIPNHILSKLQASGTDINIVIDNEAEKVIEVKPVQKTIFIEAENYRSIEDAQAEATQDFGGGLNIGYIKKGSNFSYDINIPKAGRYNANFRVSGPYVNFNLFHKDKLLCTLIEEASDHWQKYVTLKREVFLPAGNIELKIVAIGKGWNINWIDFELIE